MKHHDLLAAYNGFKTDRNRLWALISRDVRIVLVTALCVGSAGVAAPVLRDVLGWVLQF